MYTVSSSPHTRAVTSTQTIMRDVIIALIPAFLAGIYYFKFNAFLVIVVSIVSCVCSEAVWQKLNNQRIVISDLSAVVTGLLLAFNLPSTVPLWLPIIGGVFAIIMVKQFFGGVGQNFMNPALAARAFLLAAWPIQMTAWTIDGITSATPLAIIKQGGTKLPPLLDVFMGHVGGCIGETSALALLIGGTYLLYRRVISVHIPLSFIITCFIITTLAGRNAPPIYEIFSGGLILGAFFMATDYPTSPITARGKIIFGVGCGLLTAVIRIWGGYPEGVCYSILIMNLFVPLIDKYVPRRIFGGMK